MQKSKEIHSTCRELMRGGSRSFSLASQLFRKDEKVAARFLYAWCRYCDDQIDEAKTPEEAAVRLSRLYLDTQNALDGKEVRGVHFNAFQIVCREYAIPSEYPIELLKGMEMDINHSPFETFDDLRLYCYRVAGVVGLMMTHIMGISDISALDKAVQLGIAMQLTNIARDIRTDFEMGRVYLPKEWLDRHGLRRKNLLEPSQRQQLLRLVEELIQVADEFYEEGFNGLEHLPIRSALTISAAGEIYRSIGHELVKRGNQGIEQRTVVSFTKKMACLFRSTRRIIPIAVKRISKRWAPVEIDSIWRFS